MTDAVESDPGRLTILVTGAGTGIGKESVRALQAVGHAVYASVRDIDGRNANRAAELRALGAGGGAAVRVLELDVSSERSAQRAVDAIIAEAGRLDAVVHNAAHLGIGIAEAFTPDQIQSIFDTNVLGPHRVNRAALPHMRERESGLLLYVGSTTSRMVYPFQGPYEASKAAMDSMSQVMRYELARFGIDVCVVMPGAIMTGTAHFAEGTRPADDTVVAGYGRLDGMSEKITAALTEQSPAGAGPALVGDEVARVASMPAGTRPAYTIVDFLNDGAAEVNRVLDEAQAALMQRLGIADLRRSSSEAPGSRRTVWW